MRILSDVIVLYHHPRHQIKIEFFGALPHRSLEKLGQMVRNRWHEEEIVKLA
jgi:hypothetical protein